ncbi:hypothetical protein Nepgr_017137 [Nepenthes gracilis]|uniref:RING-type E3 ubiquitin transferase n=1 Tax=Nepenthes gracilis TaxID=150966 RepID=A0AAD3SRI0_NEPGR|nr:hypothetical protein Nepgr_017137 [Nepenthes gracilis]
MASESDAAETQSTQSIIERIMISRNRDLSLFMPFILSINPATTLPNPDQSSPDPNRSSLGPDHGSPNSTNPESQRERIILISPLTQDMVVIEGENLSSLLQSIPGKSGQPPASRSSIEAMPSVEISTEEDGECVICLEEWGIGGIAKEMPCKHRFHGNCIEKWLGIHGSCPVCRHQMPIDEDEGGKTSEEGRERRRENDIIRVRFSLGGMTGDVHRTAPNASDHSYSGEVNQIPSTHSGDSSSSSVADLETE